MSPQQLLKSSTSVLLLLLLLVAHFSQLTFAAPIRRKASCLMVGTKHGPALRGKLTLEEFDNGEVHIKGSISGIPLSDGTITSKKNGLHIHEWGHVGTDDGMGTGGHFNPHNAKHGLPPSPERHVGDLGNIDVNGDGVAHVDVKITDLLQLHGVHSVIGRAMILHSGEDDGSDPVGNAGSRIGQCVIGIANEAGNNSAKGAAVGSANRPRQAICELISDDGKVYGRVGFEQPNDEDVPVKVKARVCGLPKNSEHGFHVHQFGDLRGNDSVTDLVGGHYNPHDKPHGLPGSPERHMGDMGNLVVYSDGIALYSKNDLDLIMLHGEHSIIGRAVIVHEGKDDGSQPTGGAGNKLATCVIGIIDDLSEAPLDEIDCTSTPTPPPSDSTSSSSKLTTAMSVAGAFVAAVSVLLL